MKGCSLNDDGCRTWDCDECPYYKEEDIMEDNKTMTDYEVIRTTGQMLQGGFMRETDDDRDAAVVIGSIQRGDNANMCYLTGSPAEIFMILDMIIGQVADNLDCSFDQILEILQDGHHGYSGRNADNK